jgi:FkbM family methyltransferase
VAGQRLRESVLGALVRWVYPRVEPELRWVRRELPHGGTAVDVGGWFGPWTSRLARIADRVVTVEAAPELAAHLRRVFPDVRVVHAAASDQPGVTRLWVPPGGAMRGTSSVQSGDGTSVTVPTITIDSLALEDVRFIKLDIEGHELRALQGAEKTVRRDHPLVLMELEERHQPVLPVVGLLAAWGYTGYVMPGRTWVPLADFDLIEHQQATVRRVGQGLLRRVIWPRPRYVNSVLFRPAQASWPDGIFRAGREP